MSDQNQRFVMIRNARASFPQLWTDQVKDGQQFGKGVTLVLDPEKNADDIAQLKNKIAEIMVEKPKIATVVKNDPSRVCLRNGNRDEYGEGSKMLKCGCQKTPLVLNKDRTEVKGADEDPIYSGCYVNAKVELWPQDNNFGKRINAKVVAIQFAGDAEPWDSGHVPTEVAVEGFDSLDDDAAKGDMSFLD